MKDQQLSRVLLYKVRFDRKLAHWAARKPGTVAWIRAGDVFLTGTIMIVLGQLTLLVARARLALRKKTLANLKRAAAKIETRELRTRYQVPKSAEFVVCIFTPAKYRETTIIEMQLGYEFNVDRIGRLGASLSYWWEIARNTCAFCGGWKTAGKIAGSAAVCATLVKMIWG